MAAASGVSINSLFRRLHKADFQSEELLELIHFWESFPYWFGTMRVVVRAAERSPDKIKVIVSDPAGAEKFIAVTNYAFPGCGQLVLRGDDLKLQGGFQFIRLRIGESTITTTARNELADCEVSINEFVLRAAHESTETVLKPVFEAHGLDCSSFVVSGRVCRHVCKTIDGLGPTTSCWPSCAGLALNELHESDLTAVVTAERNIIRLKTQLGTQLQADIALREADAAGPEVSLPNDPRNEWLYDQFSKIERGSLVPQSTVVNRLKAKRKKLNWSFTMDISTLIRDVNKWAMRNGKPPLNPRKKGRKPKAR